MRAATGESGTDLDLSKIRELEERLDNFRIQVDGGMTIRGSAWQGYALNSKTCEELGFGGTPTPGTGACCLPDGTCEEVTPGQCLLDGGTFIGGSCTPNPCPATTGACCVGTDCTIETETDCTDMGGIYQGDGTDCDPNPCPGQTCTCYFQGFLSAGRYLTATMACSGSYDISGFSTSSWNASSTTAIDPTTCTVTCLSFSGSGISSRTDMSCTGTMTATACNAGSCTCFGNCAFSLITVSAVPYGTGSYLQWTFAGGPNCEVLFGCTNFNWSTLATFTDISDTVRQITWIGSGGGGSSWNVTTTITLSNPCVAP